MPLTRLVLYDVYHHLNRVLTPSNGRMYVKTNSLKTAHLGCAGDPIFKNSSCSLEECHYKIQFWNIWLAAGVMVVESAPAILCSRIDNLLILSRMEISLTTHPLKKKHTLGLHKKGAKRELPWPQMTSWQHIRSRSIPDIPVPPNQAQHLREIC